MASVSKPQNKLRTRRTTVSPNSHSLALDEEPQPLIDLVDHHLRLVEKGQMIDLRAQSRDKEAILVEGRVTVSF